MGERIDRVVAGIHRFFEEQAFHVTDERVIRYIVEELRRGRSFDEVIQDPYVVNHTDSEARAHLLESPRVLHGIEEQICLEFEDYERASRG